MPIWLATPAGADKVSFGCGVCSRADGRAPILAIQDATPGSPPNLATC